MNESVTVVVDDDPSVRELLLDVFESAGFDAVGAVNGVEGVAAARERHPLITTVNVALPGIDGFEAVRRLRAVSDTYIVPVSTHDDEAMRCSGFAWVPTITSPCPFDLANFARVDAIMRR